MRTAAQIDEFSLPIERQRGMVGQPLLDMLDLELLPQVAADFQGLVARLFDPLERLVHFDQPGHLGLDPREILFAQLVRQIEVVIKPLVDRRTERQANPLDTAASPPGP